MFHSSLLMLLFFLFGVIHPPRVFANVSRGNGDSCDCGFYDASTENLFTEAIIHYFNETAELPLNGFLTQKYTHRREKGWNAIYRQSADESNLVLNRSNTSSLDFLLSPPDNDHVVVGSGIETIRRDIHFGTFRTSMQSPGQKNEGGSSLSMMLQFNESQSIDLSLMNTDDTAESWVGTFVNGEFPEHALGTNYSILGNRSSEIGITSPWDFTPYKIDWTLAGINYTIGNNVTRNISADEKSDMPVIPSTFTLKHWSNGNTYSMQGPPKRRATGSVTWIRLFFNSSTTTEEMRDRFDSHCQIQHACSVDDTSLRGASPYGEEATKKWEQEKTKDVTRIPAIVLAVVCITVTSILLLHALLIRAPWKRFGKKKPQADPLATPNSASVINSERITTCKYESCSHFDSSRTCDAPSTGPSARINNDLDDLTIEPVDQNTPSSSRIQLHYQDSFHWDSRGTTPCNSGSQTPYGSRVGTPLEGGTLAPMMNCSSFALSKTSTKVNEQIHPEKKGKDGMIMLNQVPGILDAGRKETQPLAPNRKRIDYLAGLVALCSILVTVMHFCLSYVPAAVIPGAPAHNRSEYWAQKIVSPIFLNQMWLAVFFTTSCRFLCDRYLQDGNLRHVAQAAVRRVPRLMIPVTCMALLEYFIIDCGATHYLEYVPSLSWSTWPYVERFETFGHFVSEVLELVYLIPNAAPQITFHYCTGVLWTISVQLQYTWLILLGIVVIRHIKNPAKRFGYYAFCIVTNWYAQSWGSFFWVGIMLVDLDVTYKYRKWMYARAWVYYPVLNFCILLVVLSFSANIIPNWTDYNFSIDEANIHPDVETGLRIGLTPRAGYPEYYTPRLNALMFAFGAQAVIEISPAVQKALSIKVLTIVFPHIFTIYLVHGLIFWTWGSWLLIFLADRGFSYAINITIVGLTSYVVLALSLPILTPVLEILGRDLTNQVWNFASENQPPKRSTLYPFDKSLFTQSHSGIQTGQQSGQANSIDEGYEIKSKSEDSSKSMKSSQYSS